jgi:protein-histidine pros-kinase
MPRILVVEDNSEMRRFISRALATEYHLDVAADGAQGLAAALSLQPELIIADVMLPRLSGEELLNEVRKHSQLDATSILLLTTSMNSEELRARVLSEGAQDYLDKPFSVGELRARVRNLSALQRARAALVDRKAAPEAAIVDVALDGIVSMDHHGVVTGFNGAAEQIFGYSRAEAVGKPLADLIVPPSLREAHRRGLARYLASGEGQIVGKRVKLTGMRKDGTEFSLELSVLRLPGVDPAAFAGFIRDLTGAKGASRRSSEPLVVARELQLKAEQHFRELIDTAPDAMLIADRDGKILEANHQIEKLFGYTRAELLGQAIEVLVPASLRDKHKADLSAYLKAPNRRTKGAGLQLRGARKDGSEVPLEVSLSPIEMDVGHVVVAALRDLSDRVRAEHAEHELVQEQTARATAEENVRIRDDFLAVAGHELKTPLGAMLTQIQGLLRGEGGNPPVNIAERIDNLARSGVRLELIQQLLDVSRITAGRLRLDPTPCDLAELTRQVVDRYADVSAYANSPLSFTAPEHVRGMWDRLRLEAVIASLLSNAIRFGRGKPVEVEVSTEDGQAVLKVTDRGVGINREQRQRLLQRLERAVGAHEYGSFGLGLWISRNIVEASGGTIYVESAPNKGSTFTVHLPIAH